MRFVIADDGFHALMALRGILFSLGHDCVRACSDGKEAVAACREVKPDVVILDISMPVMTGDIAAREIKAMGIDNIIVASSMSQDAIAGPLRKIVRAFIVKPYRPSKLLQAIAEIERDRGVA